MDKIIFSYNTLTNAGDIMEFMPQSPAGFLWIAEILLEFNGISADTVNIVYNDDSSVTVTQK
jgi:hypothetical protein